MSVLIESMRRDGFELGVSKPEVIQKEVNGEIHEPFEQIVIDLEEEQQGAIMEEMGKKSRTKKYAARWERKNQARIYSALEGNDWV